MTRSHLIIHLLNCSIESKVTVLLVHVVVASPALITHPDTIVLDGGGVLLKNLEMKPGSLSRASNFLCLQSSLKHLNYLKKRNYLKSHYILMSSIGLRIECKAHKRLRYRSSMQEGAACNSSKLRPNSEENKFGEI